jgi:hypothetical protein
VAAVITLATGVERPGEGGTQSVDGFEDDVEAGALVVAGAGVEDLSAAGFSVELVSFLAALSPPPFSDSMAFFRDAEG